MSDLIQNLPTDDSMVNSNELHIINNLFTNEADNINKILLEMRESILGGVLFGLLSLPQVDSIIQKFVPISRNSPTILLCIKILLFIFIFYILKNLKSVKKI